MSRPPLPPFDLDGATVKVRRAEDAWNGRDPAAVALGYTPNSEWRNRAEFLVGRAAIIAFLQAKWAREHDYRLIKELWTFGGDRIAVRFAYEWHDATRQWFRSYGNENWQFDYRGADAAADRQHQRPADCRIRAPVPLAIGRSTGRPSGSERSRTVENRVR